MLDEAVARHCDAAGLNLRGVAAVSAYDDGVAAPHRLATLLPDARSVIVIGNGGAALWEAFTRYCAEHPDYRETTRNPLDTFTAQALTNVSRNLDAHDIAHRVLFYWKPEKGRFVSFMRLAELAGMGAPGRLGVTLHPTYGPWIALRAAVLTTVAMPPTELPGDFQPCVECEAPCIAACPVGAVSESGWDMHMCTRAKVERDDCGRGCTARRECVIGQDHRYPQDEIDYHSARTRRSLTAWFKATGTS